MHDHLGDRLANAISHGLGLLLSITGLIYLLHQAQTQRAFIAFLVYGLSLILLYLFSTIHHSIKMPSEKGFYLLKSLDQMAIYVLIAGTYTPLVLIGIKSPSATRLLIILWSIAIMGSVSKLVWPKRGKVLHILLYVIMGWSLLFLWSDLSTHLPATVISYIIIGGFLYTGGIPFFILSHAKKDWHYTHLLWHLCVLAGSVIHFIAVYNLI